MCVVKLEMYLYAFCAFPALFAFAPMSSVKQLFSDFVITALCTPEN